VDSYLCLALCKFRLLTFRLLRPDLKANWRDGLRCLTSACPREKSETQLQRLPRLNFALSRVRSSAAESVPLLMECAQLRGSDYVGQIWSFIAPNILGAVKDEPDKDVLSVVMESLARVCCVTMLFCFRHYSRYERVRWSVAGKKPRHKTRWINPKCLFLFSDQDICSDLYQCLRLVLNFRNLFQVAWSYLSRFTSCLVRLSGFIFTSFAEVHKVWSVESSRVDVRHNFFLIGCGLRLDIIVFMWKLPNCTIKSKLEVRTTRMRPKRGIRGLVVRWIVESGADWAFQLCRRTRSCLQTSHATKNKEINKPQMQLRIKK